MTQVTSTGFDRTRLDQRLADLIADFQAIYGTDIQVNPDDLDGQWLAIMAERLADNDLLAEAVYNSFNPNGAIGVQLSRLVQLNGIKRIAGDYSVVNLLIVGTIGTVIPAGKVVGSLNDTQQWLTTTQVTIPASGQITVNAEPSEKGPIAAASGTLTEILTPIFGWLTVTNPLKAVVGREEETDEQLRARRKYSTSFPGQSFVDAIYAALANANGVRLCRVYENDTLVTDANGQTARTIHCVLEATTSDADIAELIFINKPAGIPAIGATTVFTPDSQGILHAIKFTRAVHSLVYITVNIVKGVNYPLATGAQDIKDALVAYGATLVIGESLTVSRLYTPVNTVPYHTITSIFIGLAPAPGSAVPIPVLYTGIIDIDVSRIVVNVT